MKKIQYNGSSKILNGIVTKVNLIIDKLVVDVKVNGTSVVVVNEEGEREADIDLSLADQNVKQSPTTDNKDYRVLLSKSDNDTEETDIARKNTDFKYNPSTGNLQATKLNGNTIPTDTDTLALNKDIPTQASDIGAIPATEKGANSGVATLDSSGKVPTTQLPSYVDDVVEGYYYNDNFYEDSAHTELITPETSKIYVDLSTDTCYRWGGSAYVEISGGAVQSDWNQNDSSQLDYIKNKPTIPTIPTVTTGSVFGALSFDGTNKIVKLSADSQGSGLDLDNFKTAGEYYFSSSNTPTNIPVGNNGVLVVIESASIIKQIWMRHGTKDSNDFQSFVRTYYLSSGNWSAWHPIITGETVSSVEPTTTASKAYAIGDYLMCNGYLYRVTLAIAIGDTIVTSGSSANVTRAYIGNEIANVRNSIPTALSQLSDDQTHRLVTDTDKSTWNDERLPYGILNTEDLNDLRTSAVYVGKSGNTCLNKPTDVAQFSLLVLRTAYSSTQYCQQILFTPRGYEWRRNCYQNTWSAWSLSKLTDENVKQTAVSSSSNANYRLLLSKSASDAEETDGVYKDGGLYYNPYDETLNAPNASFATAFIPNLSVTNLVTAQYYFNHGSGSAVAMLEANSASTTSNPTMVYLPAVSGTLATLADIPTVVDEKVKQTPENNSSSEFEVLLSGTADNTEHTEGAKKSSKLKFVPWNSSLEVGTLSSGFYDGTVEAGTLKGYGVSGILLEAGDLSNKGTLSIFNNAGKAANVKFSNSATSDKSFEFPKVGGTIATLNDIPTITDTYDGTSPEGMSGIAVKSAIDALDVPSTSIGQGETLATIKEENGKIAVTKQNIKIGLGQIDNFYRCGTNNAISGSNTWYKVASVTPVPGTNEDDIILLSVMDTYLPDTTDNITDAGILYCRIRQGTSGGVDSVNYAELKFVANSGLNPSNFRLYHKTDTNGITFEIWTSMNRRYAWRKFSVISQGDRTSVYSNAWTLYNSTSPSAAPTESSTYVRVECGDNTYKQTDNNILGSKNLIPYPYPNGTPNITTNNVTISIDNDGVLTITGSNPSSNFGYGISGKTQKTVIVLDPAQSYIMSGMSGGSGSTVRFLLDLWTASQNPETDSYTTRLYQATTETIIPTGYKYLQITLYFYTSAASLFPLTVKPMLRLASIADNTFVPYSDTNKFLSSDKIGRREQEFYGSKNLLPYPWNETTVEKNGITFTDNGDGSVTANGTASANTTFYFIVRNNARWRVEVPKGMYKLTGCPSGGSAETYSLYFNAYRKGTSTAQGGLRDNGNGGYVNYSYDAWCGGYIDIKSGTRCDNLVFKPMLRPFYSTDDEYADYAQTNRQLTISKADYRDIATVETTGKASKAYAKNELMIWRGDLHRVTQAITSGGSITLNTNVVATTLSAEIKAIRDALNI